MAVAQTKIRFEPGNNLTGFNIRRETKWRGEPLVDCEPTELLGSRSRLRRDVAEICFERHARRPSPSALGEDPAARDRGARCHPT